MPSATDILSGLTRIADQAIALAIVWHAVIALTLVALLLGWRPSRRLAGVLLATPLLSVAVLAAAHGNPFNAALLGLVALLLGAIGLRLGHERVTRRAGWATVAGVVFIAFGWVYPHFLESRSVLTYLYAAPTGLIPCPSLTLVIGFALLSGGLGTRAWALVLASAGAFYGLFGALRLGVWLDVILIAAAAALATQTLATGRLPRRALV